MTALISQFQLGSTGPTVAIKDSIDIAGMKTCGGSAALADSAPAEKNADVVDALLQNNWQIIAKANMHELAYGMTGINDWSGTPVNPQDASRIPGGSSSGSASAVGAGLVDMALGSDTGGSVRVPAACCGVIGMKPTFGRVSRIGAYPRHSTLDCVGPFTRNVSMLIKAMSSITPDFDATIAASPIQVANIGLVTTDSDNMISTAIDAAVQTTGWESQAVTLDTMQAAFDAGLTIINAETWSAFGHLTGLGKLGPDVEKRLSLAGNTTAQAIEQANIVRAQITADIDRLLDTYDALILPTLPQLPPTLDDVRAGVSVIAMSALVRPFNLSGHPAITIPVPISGSTLKAGLQLVGRKGHDEQLCALALHLEKTLQQLQ